MSVLLYQSPHRVPTHELEACSTCTALPYFSLNATISVSAYYYISVSYYYISVSYYLSHTTISLSHTTISLSHATISVSHTNICVQIRLGPCWITCSLPMPAHATIPVSSYYNISACYCISVIILQNKCAHCSHYYTSVLILLHVCYSI